MRYTFVYYIIMTDVSITDRKEFVMSGVSKIYVPRRMVSSLERRYDQLEKSAVKDEILELLDELDSIAATKWNNPDQQSRLIVQYKRFMELTAN